MKLLLPMGGLLATTCPALGKKAQPFASGGRS